MKNKKHKTSQSQPPPDFLSVIPKKVETPATPSVEIVGTQFEIGWGKIRLKNWREKPVAEWNKQDMARYFYTAYCDKYGTPLCSNIPWCMAYQKLEEIRHAISHQMKLDECPPEIVKDYFDFFYQKYADDIIAQRSFPLSIDSPSRMRYIIAFVRGYHVISVKPKPSMVKFEEVHTREMPTVKDLESAYKIHAQYFVTNYGAILAANYVATVARRGVAAGEAYVAKAFDKMRGKDRTAALDATRKYGPYPRSLAITKFREEDVAICDDNGEYAFLIASE